MSLQFLTNEVGERIAVLVPIAEWREMKQRLEQQANADDVPTKEQRKEDFREALREMRAGNGRPASELLAELDELAG